MGWIICKIQEEVIDLNSWAQALAQENCGAITWFMGNVRRLNQGQEVVGITYESYAELAEKVLQQICGEAQQRWDQGLHFVVVHRVGYLQVGECSVLIGVASARRAAAYEASRFVIEEIKKRAPIWKQEHYLSGESQWLKGHSLHEV